MFHVKHLPSILPILLLSRAASSPPLPPPVLLLMRTVLQSVAPSVRMAPLLQRLTALVRTAR